MAFSMATDIVPHPEPKLSRQVGHILWISVIVSTVAFAFSMVTFGWYSLWVVPSAYAFSIAHNITLLVLSAKERKKSPKARNGTLTATSKKASIICTWILALLWTASAGMVLAFIIITSQQGFDGFEQPYFHIIPWFELFFAMIEVGVIGILGVKCVRERRQIIGLADTTKWYHLDTYNLGGSRG